MKLAVAVTAALVLTSSGQAQLGWMEKCLPYGSFAQEVRATEEEDRRPVIRVIEVRFVGGKLSRTIRRQAETSLKQTEFQDEDWLGVAQELVLDVWHQHGHMKAKAGLEAVTVRRTENRRDVIVTARVVAGPQYRLRTMTFTGGTRFGNDELREQFLLRDGDVFDVEQFRTGLANLRRSYGSLGYINFTAVPELLFDEHASTIAVSTELDEEQQYLIDQVSILGLSREQETVVASDEALQSGAAFRADLIQDIPAKYAASLPGFPALNEYRIRQEPGRISLILDFRTCPELKPD